MTSHVDKLYAMIRSKALIQYFTPFASVQMPMMAQVCVCNYVCLCVSLSVYMYVCAHSMFRFICSRAQTYGGAGLSQTLFSMSNTVYSDNLNHAGV